MHNTVAAVCRALAHLTPGLPTALGKSAEPALLALYNHHFMQPRQLHFRVGKVVWDASDSFRKEISDIVCALSDLRFVSILSERNGSQQKSDFDQSLETALKQNTRWLIEPKRNWPRLKHSADGWNPRPDIVAVAPVSNTRFLFEIEKANRYKVWDDIMKLWLFQHEHQCEHGVLVCPTLYATPTAEREPYRYARERLSLLRDAAKVQPELLRKITLIGYEQTVWNGDRYVQWNRQVCSFLKSQKRPIDGPENNVLTQG